MTIISQLFQEHFSIGLWHLMQWRLFVKWSATFIIANFIFCLPLHVLLVSLSPPLALQSSDRPWKASLCRVSCISGLTLFLATSSEALKRRVPSTSSTTWLTRAPPGWTASQTLCSERYGTHASPWRQKPTTTLFSWRWGNNFLSVFVPTCAAALGTFISCNETETWAEMEGSLLLFWDHLVYMYVARTPFFPPSSLPFSCQRSHSR